LPAHLARVVQLQRAAGNAAVTRLLQRDDAPADPSGAAPAPGPATLTIDVTQQPHTDAAGNATAAALTGQNAPAAQADPTPAAGDTSQKDVGTPGTATGGSADGQSQWQLQYNYQGQRQYGSALGRGAGQDSLAQQLTVNLNLHPFLDGHLQPAVAVQGSFDPTTGTFTGAQAQAQLALVQSLWGQKLQGQIYGQVSAGDAADASGQHATAGVAAGAQLNYNINENVAIFAQVQGAENVTQGGPSGFAYSTSAGMTFTIP
jgi:hypothetical protein